VNDDKLDEACVDSAGTAAVGFSNSAYQIGKAILSMRHRKLLRRAVSVSIEIEKKKYIGEYHVEHGLMTVWYGSRRRVVRRKLSDPRELTLARILLLDMVEADLAARGS
jgi:hypothetical protein